MNRRWPLETSQIEEMSEFSVQICGFRSSIHPTQVAAWQKAYALSKSTIQQSIAFLDAYRFATKVSEHFLEESIQSCKEVHERVMTMRADVDEMTILKHDLLEGLVSAQKTNQHFIVLGLETKLNDLVSKSEQSAATIQTLLEANFALRAQFCELKDVASGYITGVHNLFHQPPNLEARVQEAAVSDGLKHLLTVEVYDHLLLEVSGLQTELEAYLVSSAITSKHASNTIAAFQEYEIRLGAMIDKFVETTVLISAAESELRQLHISGNNTGRAELKQNITRLETECSDFIQNYLSIATNMGDAAIVLMKAVNLPGGQCCS